MSEERNPNEPEKLRINLWLPEDLIERAKIEAVKQRTSVSKMVTRLLEQALAEKDRPKQYANA
jgi:predicted DNA binding CopG/RHH family protein